MTRFRRFLALGTMTAAAALALGVSATSVSARGGNIAAGYTLDAYGALHPLTIGGVTSPSETTASAANHYWAGWQVARGFAEANNHTDGVVMDAFGGLHGWGTDTTSNAKPADPTNNAYWGGWDVARAVALQSGTNNSGYTLDAFGGVHPFGTAPAVTYTGYTGGSYIATSLELNQTATGGAGAFGCDVSGYVMDVYGNVHPFTDNKSAGDDSSCTDPANITVTTSATWPGWNIARSIVIDNDNKSATAGYTMEGFGGLHPWCAYATGGTACTLPAAITAGPYWGGWDIARAAVSTATGKGFVLDAFGGVHGYGGATDPGYSGYTGGSYLFRDIDES